MNHSFKILQFKIGLCWVVLFCKKASVQYVCFIKNLTIRCHAGLLLGEKWEVGAESYQVHNNHLAMENRSWQHIMAISSFI